MHCIYSIFFFLPAETFLSHLSYSSDILAFCFQGSILAQSVDSSNTFYSFFFILGKVFHYIIFLNTFIQWYNVCGQGFSSSVFVRWGNMHHMGEDLGFWWCQEKFHCQHMKCNRSRISTLMTVMYPQKKSVLF